MQSMNSAARAGNWYLPRRLQRRPRIVHEPLLESS